MRLTREQQIEIGNTDLAILVEVLPEPGSGPLGTRIGHSGLGGTRIGETGLSGTRIGVVTD